MSELEEKPPSSATERTETDRLLYDFFKHMTTLALLSLGGTLTLAQLPAPGQIRPVSLGIVVMLLALSGIMGFVGMDEIVKGKTEGLEVGRRVRLYRKLSALAFAFGVGAFLSVFFSAIY